MRLDAAVNMYKPGAGLRVDGGLWQARCLHITSLLTRISHQVISETTTYIFGIFVPLCANTKINIFVYLLKYIHICVLSLLYNDINLPLSTCD